MRHCSSLRLLGFWAFLWNIGCSASYSAYAPGRRSDVVTADELEAAHESNLYDALQKVRPGFLVIRPGSPLAAARAPLVVVLKEDQVVGDLAALHNMPASIARSVRRLSAADVYHLTGVFASSGGLQIRLITSLEGASKGPPRPR